MSLSPGTWLGPYQIEVMLGAGGMGEVYRGRDSRLGRAVAIKVLPSVLVSDPDRRERFDREARAAAALNHPHIVSIHDVGTDGGIPFIVSELLEGTTLREQMTPGAPWPVRKAIHVGIAIASGLAAAHTRGIVHRDLKPENVFLARDGGVKILDFGLARVAYTGTRAPQDSTLTGTEAGTVLGTIGYMSPEQVRGLSADHRADIFACGAVLFETLSGRRAFHGDTAADTITAILTRSPPPITDLEHALPPALERIIARCLEKEPDARFQSASDLAFALEALSGTFPRSSSQVDVARSRRRLFAIASVVALVALGAAYLALRYPSEPSSALPLTRLQIATRMPVMEVAVSPHGRTIAYLGAPPAAPPAIWLRSLDRAESHKLVGTDGASPGFFWSPDSRFLAFVSGGRLRKVAVEGGAVRDICAAPGEGSLGGSWNENDDIVFSTFPAEGILHVSADGGTTRLVTKVDPRHYAHRGARFLPGSRQFLYATSGAGIGRDEVCVGSLDGPEQRCIVKTSAFDHAPSGVLLFIRGAEIAAQKLDPRSLNLLGSPVVLAGPVSHGFSFSAIFAAGGNVLAVRPEGVRRTEQFTWYDRQGRSLGNVGLPHAIETFDLSPDGRRVAMARGAPTGGGEVLLVIDTIRGVTSPLTGREFDGVDDPVWSPDSRHVAFKAWRGPKPLLVVKSADGGPERVLVNGLFEDVYVEAWSPDGRFLAISYWQGQQGRGALLPVQGKPDPIVFVESANDESDFSPDGRWLAYSTVTEAGSEVFVVPVPPTGERWQVSAGGGDQPRWARDGRELYYLALDGKVMAVSIDSGRGFAAAAPRPLFHTGLLPTPGYDQFDLAPDGRFLITMPARPEEGTVIDIVLNWQSGLKR